MNLPPSQKTERYLPLLLIALTALLVYGRTIGFDFVTTWDDKKYVLENPLITDFNWTNLRTVFGTSYFGNYAPLHLVSYMFDTAIWGFNPFGFHLHNIILHALNGVLFYLFLGLFGLRRDVAFTAAFIFVCHPVQVESVAWISQRKTLLATTFLLLSLSCYRRDATEVGTTRRWYIASLLFFMAALLSKSVAVVLPLLLLSHDMVFRREQGLKKSLMQLLPYLAASLLFAIIAITTQAPEAGGGRAIYYGGGPLGTFYTMLPVFVSYLRLIVWPTGLSIDYPTLIRSVPDAAVIASGILLLLLAVVLIRLATRRDPRFFWASFFIAGILPVSQIVPLVTLMNDRYLYIPMLGVSVLVADSVFRILSKFTVFHPAGRGGTGWEWGRILLVSLLALPLLLLPGLSYQRAGDWKNGITLWGRDLKKYPQNHIIMTSFADSFREAGRQEEAIKLYQQALAINPRYFIALNNYTNLLLEAGKPEQAQGFANNLVHHYPLYAKGFEMLGLSYELTGEMEKSEKGYREALRLNPDMPDSLISLAIIRLRLGSVDEARTLLAKAEKLGKSPQLSYSIACFELTVGNREESVRRIREAAEMGFDNFEQLLGDPCMKPVLDHPEIQELVTRNNK